MVLTHKKRELDPKLPLNTSSFVPECYAILHRFNFLCLEGIYLNLIPKVCALLYNRSSDEQNQWNSHLKAKI